MSVINRVLKELDRKGIAPASLAGVHAVQTGQKPSWPRWLLLLLPVGLAAAWWFWPRPQPQPEAPVAAPVAQGTEPRLRLSDTLSIPPLAAPPVESSTDAQPTLPEPDGNAPRREIPPGTPTAVPLAKPLVADASAGEGKSTPPRIKLDTHLPETRQPKVIKEVRPPSPGEQVDQAWRQAMRLVELGRGRDALEGLESTLRLDPNHGPARQTLIALSLEAGDTARGETLLREGMQLHANDAWYNRGLGQLHLQRGDTRQSLAILKSGIGKGVDAAYWGLYAGVLAKSGQHEEAAQAYREAARLNPAHGPWWIGFAVSLEHTGQRPDAAAAYQRALQARLSPELREFAARKAGEQGTP
ncbi:MAG: tetratricopeptide repeat protein [Pseudomonadota bacterium]|nr:tetratricopeptide repeat protein [Pseudomonadota bacterium]